MTRATISSEQQNLHKVTSQLKYVKYLGWSPVYDISSATDSQDTVSEDCTSPHSHFYDVITESNES